MAEETNIGKESTNRLADDVEFSLHSSIMFYLALLWQKLHTLEERNPALGNLESIDVWPPACERVLREETTKCFTYIQITLEGKSWKPLSGWVSLNKGRRTIIQLLTLSSNRLPTLGFGCQWDEMPRPKRSTAYHPCFRNLFDHSYNLQGKGINWRILNATEEAFEELMRGNKAGEEGQPGRAPPTSGSVETSGVSMQTAPSWASQQQTFRLPRPSQSHGDPVRADLAPASVPPSSSMAYRRQNHRFPFPSR